MKKRIFIALIAMVTLISLVSCSGRENNGAYKEANDKTPIDIEKPMMPDIAYEEYDSAYNNGYLSGGMADYPKEDVTVDHVNSSNDLANRKIIKNASISFQTTAYDQLISSINSCISHYGGYIESSDSYGGGAYQTNYSRNASITARIPADRYDIFMNDATQLGSVTHRSENSSDVTASYIDTESRIKALEAEYNALLAILEKASVLEDVISLQARISDVTYELESYKSTLRRYDDLISYCTVHINISEVKREIINEDKLTLSERMTEGLNETIDDMQERIEDFSVSFVSSLPYIAIWAVIIAIIVIVIVTIIKKNKRKLNREVKDDGKKAE